MIYEANSLFQCWNIFEHGSSSVEWKNSPSKFIKSNYRMTICLDPFDTLSYFASHPDPSFIHILAITIYIGLNPMYKYKHNGRSLHTNSYIIRSTPLVWYTQCLKVDTVKLVNFKIYFLFIKMCRFIYIYMMQTLYFTFNIIVATDTCL